MLDVQKANNLGRKLYTIVTSILFIAYLAQYIKGDTGLIQFILIIITDLCPVVVAHLIYKKKPDAYIIRHIIGGGYGLFYIVCCCVSEERMVFVYAIPMLVVVSIYCDNKFSIIVSILVSAIAVTHGIAFTAAENWTHKSVAALEIEIAAVLLISAFCYVANSFITAMNEKNIRDINEAGAKTQNMLNNIVSISGELADDVSAVSVQMEVLETSSENTLSAMTEVQSGTTETADSVQVQLLKTEEIQKQVAMVGDVSENIGESVKQALHAIDEGRSNLNKLIAQAKISDEAGNGAVKEVEELKGYTDKMESIVQMIKDVASQTSLLALNASIEAARAGEAGRGFAVVASEISSLASQTSTATENISSLIANVTSEMQDVAKAIVSLVESNKIQNESAQVTSGSFDKIIESAGEIKNNSERLGETVGSLESANKEIVESIQTISAITEEVSAHSQTTCSASEQNKVIVDDVKNLVANMKVNADKLKAIV